MLWIDETGLLRYRIVEMLLELLDELVVGVDVGAGLLLFWGWQVGRAGQGFYQFAGQAHLDVYSL